MPKIYELKYKLQKNMAEEISSHNRDQFELCAKEYLNIIEYSEHKLEFKWFVDEDGETKLKPVNQEN